MTDYTLMQLVNWLESAACKCFYIFEGSYIKPRCITPTKSKNREECLQDSKGLVTLCQNLYKLQLPYKTHCK